MSDDKSCQPVLIEQTAKKYKLIRGVGILILLLSAVFGVLNADNLGTKEGIATIVTAIGFVAGVIVFGTGVLLSWWHHG